MYDISESGMTKKVEYRGQRGFARFGMASHVSETLYNINERKCFHVETYSSSLGNVYVLSKWDATHIIGDL